MDQANISMKRAIIIFSALTAASPSISAQVIIPVPEIQIKTALLAAPADKRENATVLGYDPKGNTVELRKGTNEMICLADDPNLPGLSVASYHKDLEPYMKRGRELRASGKSASEATTLRDEEVKAGKLQMPKQPASLYVYNAKAENYNPATGDVKDGYLRYVIYTPYATPESTGLPLKPDGPGMPWIMDPGTHKAHIMINPPQRSN